MLSAPVDTVDEDDLDKALREIRAMTVDRAKVYGRAAGDPAMENDDALLEEIGQNMAKTTEIMRAKVFGLPPGA